MIPALLIQIRYWVILLNNYEMFPTAPYSTYLITEKKYTIPVTIWAMISC